MATSQLETDVCIYGAGMGGVAAALTLLEQGYRVVVFEPTGWIGGQMTSQGVSALDEHEYVEEHPGTARYGALRDAIRRRSALLNGITGDVPHAYNPGNGWVSRLCFLPVVAHDILCEWFAPWIQAGTCVLVCNAHIISVATSTQRIYSVQCRTADQTITCSARLFIDAGELGDVLNLAGCETVSGAESYTDTKEDWAPQEANPREVQGFTYSFAVEYVPHTSNIIAKPEGYIQLRTDQPFTLTLSGSDGVARPFRVFDEGITGLPPFWTYRRIREGKNCNPSQNDIALINWNSNDYHRRTLIGATPHTISSITDEAKRLSLAFLYYLQTDVPRDDGTGYGYPELRLRPDIMGTADGLSMAPYIRESRRTRGLARITAHDVLTTHQPHARARHWPDTIGIGWYPLDLHPAPGNPTSRYEATRPFQIPLGASIPPDCHNLFCANKNIATTHLSNGSYRLHPVEWSIGTGAGMAAAVALKHHTTPADIVRQKDLLHEVQRRLMHSGTALGWAIDVKPTDAIFVGTQWCISNDILSDSSWRRSQLRVAPDEPLTAAEYDRLQNALMEWFGTQLPTNTSTEVTWRAASFFVQQLLAGEP
ncbi:MAG: FAD-dependent oxidoreductase [Roseiflexaceae bacterium]